MSGVVSGVVTPTVIALLVFAASTVIMVAVAMLIHDLKRPDEDLHRRLGLTLQQLQATPEHASLQQPADGWIDRAFYQLSENSGSKLDRQTAVTLVAGAALIGCAAPLVFFDNLPAAAAGLLLGAVLPICWWTFRRARRMAAFEKNLPEALELLADGVRAGQTLEQAAALVAAQAPAPLSEEFGYCVSQLRLGHSPVAVLSRMARRIPIPEFRIFATAVLVHRQTGGNLALLAQRLANSGRDRGEFRGHVKAVTSGSRLSVIGLTIGALVAMGILASLRPEYLSAFVEHELGPTLLVTAAVLQVVGILWVWRILKVHF